MKLCGLEPVSFEKEKSYLELNVALAHLRCVLIQSMSMSCVPFLQVGLVEHAALLDGYDDFMLFMGWFH